VFEEMLAGALRVGRVRPLDLMEPAEGAPQMGGVHLPIDAMMREVPLPPAVRPRFHDGEGVIGKGAHEGAPPLTTLDAGRGAEKERAGHHHDDPSRSSHAR
jgi:hypothetical protein